MQHRVVIGAHFGDEGKGLMTDYFASQLLDSTVVVRFNGGAQAGHTVVTPKGDRHVFSHFGSGTLLGVPTYLSQFFIVNPLLFLTELDALGGSLKAPIYVDLRCLVSTPYDMLLNQVQENERGTARHGSCGVGINETVVRNSTPEYQLRMADLMSNKWRDKFKRIADEYYPSRLDQLGYETDDEFSYEKFVERFETFITHPTPSIGRCLYGKNIVFEGAQGLLLDQNNEVHFPHVTRSNTGYQNVKTLLERYCTNQDEVEAVYVTRAYVTRHGAGWFQTELSDETPPWGPDETNQTNTYQGAFRYGLLDIDMLRQQISDDMQRNRLERASLAVTCLDQVGPRVKYLRNGFEHLDRIPEFTAMLKRNLPVERLYMSFGNTREDVTYV